jgi:hypothetical protein
MESIAQFKTCRKGLHQYPADKRQCPECRIEYKRNWDKENREQNQKLKQKWHEANRERNLAAMRKRHADNPMRGREQARKWERDNLERSRQLHRQWIKANRGKVNANTAKRRAAKKQAIAAWANHNEIKEIYKECARLTKETGVKHQVDHIYPLQNKYMCGLHVENNLQILSATENTIKSNKFWPGQLDCQKP